MDNRLPVYLRCVEVGKGRFDVLAYRDPEGLQQFARWTWDLSNRPRKGAKTVTLNCYLWRAVWLEPVLLKGAQQ